MAGSSKNTSTKTNIQSLKTTGKVVLGWIFDTHSLCLPTQFQVFAAGSGSKSIKKYINKLDNWDTPFHTSFQWFFFF